MPMNTHTVTKHHAAQLLAEIAERGRAKEIGTEHIHAEMAPAARIRNNVIGSSLATVTRPLATAGR